MLLLLFLLALPVLEVVVIVEVAEAIGVLLTLVLLIVTSPIGVRLMRAQGRVVLRRFSAAVAEGRPPAREALDGVLVFVGGVLLVIPGFITDSFGLLLMLPPTRALARTVLARRARRRIVVVHGSDYDVESTATEIPRSELRRPEEY
ncbi:MAG TPA: FxsA family protein [Solirubrobacteraceae bacterium]|nr:FxsA family protein [Solirubrobacteraceae bacterium]